MTVSADKPALLTPAEVAERIGVRVQTLAVWRTSGRYGLPYIRAGRLIRYRADDVDAWLNKRRQTHTGERLER